MRVVAVCFVASFAFAQAALAESKKDALPAEALYFKGAGQ